VTAYKSEPSMPYLIISINHDNTHTIQSTVIFMPWIQPENRRRWR